MEARIIYCEEEILKVIEDVTKKTFLPPAGMKWEACNVAYSNKIECLLLPIKKED